MKYVTFGFALVIGLLCILISIRMIGLFLRTGSWAKTEAKIINKGIRLKPGNLHPGKANYIPDVIYSYVFNGTEYTQTNVYLESLLKGNRSFTEKALKTKVEKIPDTLIVFVNPANPSQAVLFRSGAAMYIFIFFLGLLSILTGIGFLVG